MTRYNARDVIEKYMGWFKNNSEIYEALKMAIQALSQEQCYDAISRVEALKIATTEYELKKIRELPSVNPIPCSDAISRDAAIEAVSEGCQE